MALTNPFVPDTDENTGRSLCPECPTYNRCTKSNFEHLFCSRGNTECTLDEEGEFIENTIMERIGNKKLLLLQKQPKNIIKKLN